MARISHHASQIVTAVSSQMSRKSRDEQLREYCQLAGRVTDWDKLNASLQAAVLLSSNDLTIEEITSLNARASQVRVRGQFYVHHDGKRWIAADCPPK